MACNTTYSMYMPSFNSISQYMQKTRKPSKNKKHGKNHCPTSEHTIFAKIGAYVVLMSNIMLLAWYLMVLDLTSSSIWLTCYQVYTGLLPLIKRYVEADCFSTATLLELDFKDLLGYWVGTQKFGIRNACILRHHQIATLQVYAPKCIRHYSTNGLLPSKFFWTTYTWKVA